MTAIVPRDVLFAMTMIAQPVHAPMVVAVVLRVLANLTPSAGLTAQYARIARLAANCAILLRANAFPARMVTVYVRERVLCVMITIVQLISAAVAAAALPVWPNLIPSAELIARPAWIVRPAAKSAISEAALA